MDETRKKLENAAKKTAELSKKMDEWRTQLEQQENSPANFKMMVEMARGILGLNKAFIALTRRIDALESHVYGSSEIKGEEKEVNTQSEPTTDHSVNLFV